MVVSQFDLSPLTSTNQSERKSKKPHDRLLYLIGGPNKRSRDKDPHRRMC